MALLYGGGIGRGRRHGDAARSGATDGPVRTDLIGADVCLAIGSALFEEFHTTTDSPSSELQRRVLLGWLGRKSGRGYYDDESGGESGS
jgi:3-hydroxyacyl-CoA dehydrogenase